MAIQGFRGEIGHEADTRQEGGRGLECLLGLLFLCLDRRNEWESPAADVHNRSLPSLACSYQDAQQLQQLHLEASLEIASADLYLTKNLRERT